MAPLGCHRRVEQRGDVHQQTWPFEDPTIRHHRRAANDVGEARCDCRGRAERSVEAAQYRRGGEHGVDLRLVSLVVSDIPPAADEVVSRGRGVLQPAQERVVRIACRHDDRSGDLGTVGEGDPAHSPAAAHDRVDRALGAQCSASALERGEQCGGHLATTSDRTTDAGDVAHCVGQRAEAAARHLRADTPHHRAGERGRPHDCVVVEERSQHISSAPPRPAHQRARTTEAPPERQFGEPGEGRRLGSSLENHPHCRGGSIDVAPIAVDLGGKVTADVVERGVEVVVVRPALAVGDAGPREIVLGRFEVDVLQAVCPQSEFLDHRCGAERQMVAVADVDRCPGELLARSGAAHVRSRFDQQCRHAGTGQICGSDEAVVARSDDDGVVVARRGSGTRRSGGHSLSLSQFDGWGRNVPLCLS